MVCAYSFASTGDDDTYEMPTDSLIYAWKINNDFQDVANYPIDTNTENIHLIDPIYQNGHFYSSLGNIGSPYKNMNFFKHKDNVNFLFLNHLSGYLNLPQNRAYFNTRRPFSKIKYSTNFSVKEKQSQQVSFFHTQNVNRKLNGGFDYNLISSEGQYANQKNKIGNFTLFSSYTGKQYISHTNININNLTILQNGGVVLDEYMSNIKNTKTYTTNLNDAESKFRNRSVFTMHTFRFGAIEDNNEKLSLHDSLAVDNLNFGGSPDTVSNQHIADTLVDTVKSTPLYRHSLTYKFNYEDNLMRYSDINPTDATPGYYDTIYKTGDTYDSSSLRSISNSLGYRFLVFPERNINTGAFINNDIRRYSILTHNKDDAPSGSDSITPPAADTILYDKNHQYNTNLSFYIDQEKNAFHWNLKADYHLFGYYKNDYALSGLWWNHLPVSKDSMGLSLSGEFSSRKPDYFLQRYLSNHVRWDNDFKALKNMNFNISLDNYSRQLSLGFDYAMIHNHVYFDTSYTPRQYEKPANIYALSLYKMFAFWKIRSKNNILLQQTDNENILRLPLLCFYNSTYLQHTLNFESTGGSIDLQLGFDFYYNTKYDIYKYMPAINQFYLQDAESHGNYPYFDVFLNLKVQRVRLFVKYSHANYYLMEDRCFGAYSYPVNEPVFRFGVYWSFYN